MKAAIVSKYNKIGIKEIPKPKIQNEEVLIKVKFASICGSDIHLFKGELSTAKIPVVLGHEICGEIAEISSKANTHLKINDTVVVQPYISCEKCEMCSQGKNNICENLKIFGINEQGGFAEYVKAPINRVYRLPKEIDPRLGALVEPLAVAVHDVNRSNIKIGQSVFIIGGGPIGLLIALICKLNGAGQIVISEVNEYRLNFAEKLGFRTINPLETNSTKEILNFSNEKGFDVVFEASGTEQGADLMVKQAKAGGVIIVVGMPKNPYPIDIMKCDIKELDIRGCRLHSQGDFSTAVNIIRNGEINNQLLKFITKVFPLDEIENVFKFILKNNEYIKILLKL